MMIHLLRNLPTPLRKLDALKITLKRKNLRNPLPHHCPTWNFIQPPENFVVLDHLSHARHLIHWISSFNTIEKD
ncbi:MAG: hypothetical protein OSB05_10450 [Akkermansiaceae bacterium]|nr:hypothetical protein [Akkermansiaceae bacterium]